MSKSKKKRVSHKKLVVKKKKIIEKPAEITIPKLKLNEFITRHMGPEAIMVISELQKRRNVSEFTLAEKLKISINQFRNIIYKLDSFNLVSYTRRKDKQKGWYVYYWTFYPERLEKLYWWMKKKKLEHLKKRLELEQTGSFYICPNKCIRVSSSEGMELSFRCNECGKILVEDKTNALKNLTKEILGLEEELKQSNQSA